MKVIQMNVIAFSMKLSLFALAFMLVALSGTPVAAAATPKVLFEENFSGKLGAGWQWLRERPEVWRIADGSLIIDTLPGSYWEKQNSGQNTLLRKAPASLKDGFMHATRSGGITASRLQTRSSRLLPCLMACTLGCRHIPFYSPYGVELVAA